MSTIDMIAIITHLLLIVYKLEFDNYTTDRCIFFSLHIQNKAKILTALFKILKFNFFFFVALLFLKICTTIRVICNNEANERYQIQNTCIINFNIYICIL